MKLFQNKYLLLIFIGGLALRFLFLRYGAVHYYGSWDAVFSNGDTASYVQSFTNLLHHRSYTFDFNEPDAAFGRLPGYPFFFGVHYLLFGAKNAMLATACSQAIIDSLAIIIVFDTLARLFPGQRQPAYVGALVYATYPFTIIWTSVIGTESIAVFLVLLWFNALVRYRFTLGYNFGLGMLCAVCLYVREYLGVLLPISLVYALAITWRNAGATQLMLVRSICMSAGFLILYLIWPIRNYISFHRVMLLKPSTAGYANYKADIVGFRNWVHCWTNDEQMWLDSATFARQITYPADIFASAAEQRHAINITWQARLHGTSFYLYRTKKYGEPTYRNATERQEQEQQNQVIGARFDSLRTNFIARSPMRYWLGTPSLNLQKAFFKSTKQQPGVFKLLIKGLFLYRTVLLLLGVAGLAVFYRRKEFWPVLMFWLFMYLFISFIMRNLEMRYLLQADAIMLLPAAALLGRMLRNVLPQAAKAVPVPIA